MLRQSFTQGYLLKEAFDTADKDATKIDVRLPEDLLNNVPLNFGSIELKTKYQKQIKMKKKKIEDIQKMAPMLIGDEDWVTTLLEEQKDAIDYKEDDDEGLFVTNMDLINEVPIRVDASQQSEEP